MQKDTENWEKYKVKGDWRVNGFVFDHYVIPECELPHLLSSERQRLIEKIEGLGQINFDDKVNGKGKETYDEAIDDVLLQLKEGK